MKGAAQIEVWNRVQIDGNVQDSFQKLFTHNLDIFIIFSGDIVIKEGTVGNKMFFIQEGIVDVVLAGAEAEVVLAAIRVAGEL